MKSRAMHKSIIFQFLVLFNPHSSSLPLSLPSLPPSLDTQVAPLWDSAARKFVGIMVITDFIDTVRRRVREGGGEGRIGDRN